MAPVLGWIVLALLGSAAVLVLASVAGGTEGRLSQFLADLRSGRGGPGTAPARAPEGPADTIFADAPEGDAPPSAVLPARGAAAAFRGVLGEVPGPRDASVDEIFTIGSTDDPAYLDAEELSRTLSRATHRAIRGVQHLTRR